MSFGLKRAKNIMYTTRARSLAVLTLIALTGILISGCSLVNSGNGARTYYTGYKSLTMSFLSGSPPTTFYYDSQQPTGSQVNMLPITVQISNDGSSDTYGALFIQGLDPHIFAVNGYTGVQQGNTWDSSWSQPSFNGWYYNDQTYALNINGITSGNSMLGFGFQRINGQNTYSFSIFNGNNNNNRASLFQNLGYTDITGGYKTYPGISNQLISGAVGGALTPITQSMFKTFWNDPSSASQGMGWLQTITLKGRSPQNPGGDLTVVQFPANILTLPPAMDQFTQRVMVTACYDYATHASAMVCLDPQPYSNTRKVCNPGTVSLPGGQGGPVSVTSIDQKPANGRTSFIINVHYTPQNTYDQLFDYFSLYKCDPLNGQTVTANDLNIVYVGYVYLSNYDITLTCIPNQVIRLDQSGNGQIICSANIPTGSNAYQAPMTIELWYGYQSSIYKDILIKQI